MSNKLKFQSTKRILGEGGYGTVFATNDPNYAIKIFKEDKDHDSVNNRKKELESNGKLIDVFKGNPSIITKYTLLHAQYSRDDNISDGIIYQRCRGYTLFEYIYNKNKKDKVREALNNPKSVMKYIDCIYNVYECMHTFFIPLWEQNYLHCDIKPKNIMICGKDDYVRIIDLGGLINGTKCVTRTDTYHPQYKVDVINLLKGCHPGLFYDYDGIVHWIEKYTHDNNDVYACCVTLLEMVAPVMKYIREGSSISREITESSDRIHICIHDILSTSKLVDVNYFKNQ